MNKGVNIFILFIISLALPCIAQPKQKFVDPREAEEHFSHNNYLMAIKVYKELIKQYPKDPTYNKNIGICYLNTNMNKASAIPYLETATKQDKVDNECWFLLGRAYQYAEKIDEAIAAYTKYKEKAVKKDQENADHMIETCENARQLMKFPVNVTFENLGKELNTEFPDYYPLVPADESFIIFTTRRKGAGGGPEIDGFYPSDIYISTVTKGVFSKAKPIGPAINSSYDEQAVSLSADGKYLVVYLDRIDSLGNIYSSENKKGFQKLVRLPGEVNAGFETSGSLSPDGNTIYFASERKGGFGETDIYMQKKLPNGKWGLTQNLGPEINTKYREDMPQIAPDGKTLYFSSEGHSSMGDFDIFKTVYNEETNTWSAPKNLGYPINTTDDNRSISFSKDDRVGYMSSTRRGGMGDLDLYRIRFNDADQRYCIVSGYVNTGDSLNRKVNAQMNVKEQKTKAEYSFTPFPKNGKYVMALPPGNYTVEIETEGFQKITDSIVIFDMGSFQPEMKKDFILQKNP